MATYKKSRFTVSIIQKEEEANKTIKNKCGINKRLESISENDEYAAIIESISKSIRLSKSVIMDIKTENAARKYYESIVNNNTLNYDEKRLKIYRDLIVGSKAKLNININNEINKNAFCLNYKIGETENICNINTKYGALTIGRYKESDIWTGCKDESISRIQCFILIIESSLIILDGWSFMGTKTLQINENKKNNLKDSIPNKRHILRFNLNDTIHLRFGQGKINLILNPKTCVVCMDKARSIRNKCGHFVLCTHCYKNILNTKSKCPICYAPMNKSINHNINNNNDDNMYLSYYKPK